MSLGKRSRAPMKRTTSLTEITFDVGCTSLELQSAPPLAHHNSLPNTPKPGGSDQRFLPRRNSADLRACSLCLRPLFPGRDIYMYRGDKAFCSEECRKQQIKQDERMEKCSNIASKKAAAVVAAAAAAASTSAAVPPQISGKGETVAAS